VQTAELRAALKTSADNRQGAALFTALYPSWCHSAVAAVSLCLLSQVRGSA
jgi:vacuole morphology and inheritance protein 14